MSETPATTTTMSTTVTTPRGGLDSSSQRSPRALASITTSRPGDRSSSARRTTTSFTMHAASLPNSSTERRTSAAMTPKQQQPLTSQLLDALPETNLVWPTPRHGASSTGRPSVRTPSRGGLCGDVSSTSGNTSGTSSRCRSAHLVTPHRVPASTPPPLLDVDHHNTSRGAASNPYGRLPPQHAVARDPLRDSSTSGRHSPDSAHPHALDLVPLAGSAAARTFHVHPSEAPSAAYEAEAATMSHEALMAAVRTLREDVRVLNTSVERDHAQLANLQSGLNRLYADVERQQESIANTLLRRIHRVKRAKERLQIELYQTEREKAERRAKLVETKQSVGRVKSHMKREEDTIVQRLHQKLRHQQQQREQLDALLEEHAASLQTLEQLVNEVQSMDIHTLTSATSSAVDGALVGGAAAVECVTPKEQSSALSNTSTSASAPRSPHARPSTVPGSGISSAMRKESGGVPLSRSHSHSHSKMDSSSAPTPRPVPSPLPAAPPAASLATLGISSGGGGGMSGSGVLPPRHERSSSQLSAASTSLLADQTAHDPRDMVTYLEQEIAAVESMRLDVVSRANAYEEKCAELRRRLQHGARVKGESSRRLSQVEQALEDTSTKATTLAVAQQLASEMDSERMLNEALAGGRSPYRVGSASGSASGTPLHTFARSPQGSTQFSQHANAARTLSGSSFDQRDGAHPQQTAPQRVSHLSVQSTARMEQPRPLVDSTATTPLRSPQIPGSDAAVPPPLNLNT